MTDVDRRTFLTHAAGGVAAMALIPNLSCIRQLLAQRHAPRRRDRCRSPGREILGELTKLPDVEVTAMCDTDERRLSAGLRRASSAEGYNTVDEMLSSGKVDAVVVATSTHTHRGGGQVLQCRRPCLPRMPARPHA
ncbi:MAG: Gfo/Idh/MocA family oxidoreductase [Phycisphaerales bacterium]